ncbi:unnamed protein product, partial [Adineta ricciae]
CFYILFYMNLIEMYSTTVTESNITLDTYKQLYSKHKKTLLCSCSTITIRYENFISNNITNHPICSSILMKSEWMFALYFKEASQYGVWDFRTTAYSQFKLLSSFCSFSKEIISQTQNEINNNELITLHLLSFEQFQTEVNERIEYFKNSSASRMITFLNYLKNTNNKHYFVSALNTNLVVQTGYYEQNGDRYFKAREVKYDDAEDGMTCNEDSLITRVVLNPLPYQSIPYSIRHQIKSLPNSIIVNGFLTGCTPLEALLQSKLDCLYEVKCLQLLVNYFPKLTEVWIK